MAGTLTPESFRQLRALISYYSYQAYEPAKEAILQERLHHLKNNNNEEYAKAIQRSAMSLKRY